MILLTKFIFKTIKRGIIALAVVLALIYFSVFIPNIVSVGSLTIPSEVIKLVDTSKVLKLELSDSNIVKVPTLKDIKIKIEGEWIPMNKIRFGTVTTNTVVIQYGTGNYTIKDHDTIKALQIISKFRK